MHTRARTQLLCPTNAPQTWMGCSCDSASAPVLLLVALPLLPPSLLLLPLKLLLLAARGLARGAVGAGLGLGVGGRSTGAGHGLSGGLIICLFIHRNACTMPG